MGEMPEKEDFSQTLQRWLGELDPKGLCIDPQHIQRTHSLIVLDNWPEIMEQLAEDWPTFYDLVVTVVQEASEKLTRGLTESLDFLIGVRSTNDMIAVLALVFLPIYCANGCWPAVADETVFQYYDQIRQQYRWRDGPLMQKFREKIRKAEGEQYLREIRTLINYLKLEPVQLREIALLTLVFFDLVML